ncbi:Bacterial alpha-L-rhamnosidase [Fusarium albosuccineum]|uniref:Bacterial alpha-L-rhamnosidase n=1 Tax=Fusarium albosuccineum TaxID=1237068 RepID=A0A8H4L0S4_9HYPO|nr:Bacterial alpha-L-rhamnosidase [Fusarium albosuccineum]
MIADHYEYYADDAFVRQFVAVCDAVLETFNGHIDQDLGLVCAWNSPGYWEYTDWTRTWAPQGVPPAYKRTGFSTYINLLYVYTLRRQAWLLCHLKRPGVAQEYEQRAYAVGAAVLARCFDGEFFTDGLFKGPLPAHEFSQHCQVWAVLAGVVTGDRAARIRDEALAKGNPLSQASYDIDVPPPDDSKIYETGDDRLFTETSVSFKFYVIRALSVAGEHVYNRHFDKFWDYWRAQAANNVSTWPEDSVCVRSDCHAWGSVPIHEFITEVAGVKPAEPGWQVIAFKPRLQLFSKFEARVPIQDKKLIHVRWFEKDDADQEQALVVRLRLETEGDEDATVLVTLPDRKPETITLSTSEISYGRSFSGSSEIYGYETRGTEPEHSSKTGRKLGRPRKDWAQPEASAPLSQSSLSLSPTVSGAGSHVLDGTKLELLVHFATHTGPSLADPGDADGLISHFWAHNVPQIGLSFPFVLDLIFALSARHIVYLGQSRCLSKEALLNIAEQHLAAGMTAVTQFLPLMDDKNCGTLFVGAILVCNCLLAAGPIGPEDLLICRLTDNEGHQRLWTPVIRGVRFILETAAPETLFSGLLDPLVPGKDNNALSRRPSYIGQNFPRINWTGPVNRLRDLVISVKDEHHNVRLRAFNPLANIYEATYGKDEDPSCDIEAENKFVFKWIYCLDDGYITCLLRKDPLVLLILAYYSPLFNSMRSNWFIKDWVEHLVTRARDLTGEEYSE